MGVGPTTLWGVGPHPDAYSHLDEIRQPIFAGKVDEAEKLSENLMGKPKLLMPYQPCCDLHLHLPGHGQATEYRRELHIDDTIAETVYKVGSVTLRREVFCEPRHVAEFSVLPTNPPAGQSGR